MVRELQWDYFNCKITWKFAILVKIMKPCMITYDSSALLKIKCAWRQIPIKSFIIIRLDTISIWIIVKYLFKIIFYFSNYLNLMLIRFFKFNL